MSPTNIILPLSIITLMTPALLAQGPPPRGPRPAPPMIQALDKDEDGTLSKWEIKKAAKALAKLDEDDDGALSAEELRPPRPDGDDERRRPRRGKKDKEEDGQDGPPQGGQQGPPPSPILEAIDTDKDGSISAEEMENAPKALAALDTDEDGEIDLRDLAPPRPDGGQGPEGNGPPQGGPEGEGNGEGRPHPPHRGGPQGGGR